MMNNPCDYCIGIYRNTPSSPKRKYKYCPMCGRKLDLDSKSGNRGADEFI